jgi:hypothetical protein
MQCRRAGRKDLHHEGHEEHEVKKFNMSISEPFVRFVVMTQLLHCLLENR